MSKFQVGQTWKTRGGFTAKIQGIGPSSTYPLRGIVSGYDTNESEVEEWTEEGHYLTNGRQSILDLLYLDEPEEETVCTMEEAFETEEKRSERLELAKAIYLQALPTMRSREDTDACAAFAMQATNSFFKEFDR